MHRCVRWRKRSGDGIARPGCGRGRLTSPRPRPGSTRRPDCIAVSKTCSRSSSTRPGGRRSTGKRSPQGVFVWNSEVGKQSVGIQTFWFQKVCANHIVWDAVEVIEFARKHTARVGSALDDIRRHV